jgi:hypothetical protein
LAKEDALNPGGQYLMVSAMRKSVQDESLPGNRAKVTAVGEKDVGVELGAPCKERRDGFQILLHRGSVGSEIGDDFSPKATGKAGLHALLKEFDASSLEDQVFAIDTKNVVCEEGPGVALRVGSL